MDDRRLRLQLLLHPELVERRRVVLHLKPDIPIGLARSDPDVVPDFRGDPLERVAVVNDLVDGPTLSLHDDHVPLFKDVREHDAHVIDILRMADRVHEQLLDVAWDGVNHAIDEDIDTVRNEALVAGGGVELEHLVAVGDGEDRHLDVWKPTVSLFGQNGSILDDSGRGSQDAVQSRSRRHLGHRRQ